LAGGVAHDFNNLLFGIVGNSELIKRGCKDKAIQDYAQQICDIALKGGSLTRQLLTFARKGQYVISLLDVRRSMSNVVQILKHSLDKRISIEVKASAEPLLVKTDAAQLENAILNLAINARDAMPLGGQLVMEAGVTRLDEGYCGKLAFECLPGDYVEITVSDTGTGMDKETLSHVFEPFFTTKEPGKGTGLGLSSVFGFAKQMKGHVHVHSEKGRGSLFKIRLPLSREKETERNEEESVIVKGSGHILLIEDEQGIRDLVQRFLIELGYSVTCCVDGEEGVRYFREISENVDMVILDLIMPKLGGHDCFVELRKIDPSIPVVISSGFGIDTEVQKMLDSGAKGFIQKPYRFADLSKIISEKIRKRPTAGALPVNGKSM
jgi:CheY-like chemotaxis protein